MFSAACHGARASPRDASKSEPLRSSRDHPQLRRRPAETVTAHATCLTSDSGGLAPANVHSNMATCAGGSSLRRAGSGHSGGARGQTHEPCLGSLQKVNPSTSFDGKSYAVPSDGDQERDQQVQRQRRNSATSVASTMLGPAISATLVEQAAQAHPPRDGDPEISIVLAQPGDRLRVTESSQDFGGHRDRNSRDLRNGWLAVVSKQ